jgi:hypothetical protein
MSQDYQESKFVRGATALGWLDHAGRLGTLELAVALYAWIGHGLDGDQPVTILAPIFALFGIGAGDVDRAVRRLEGAALVRVWRAPGEPDRVTVLPVPSVASATRQQSA